MGWLSDFFSNPIETTWDTMGQLPGSLEGGLTGLYNGVNGDLSWNPYDPDGPSVLEYGAAGTKLPENNEDRKWGRMFGTAVGGAFTGGALSSVMGSTAAGGAASGALWSGAQAAGAGGDSSQIGKSMARGAAGGGLSGALPSTAGTVGIENPHLASAWDGAVKGGVGAAAQGGDRSEIGQGIVTGAAPGLASYGSSQMSAPESYVSTSPGQGFLNDMKQQSAAPGASPSPTFAKEPMATSYVPSSSPAAYTNVSGQKSALSFESPTLQAFMDKVVPQNAGQWGDLAQGLMGMYAGHRQRKDAKDMMRRISGRRDAYGQQLQGSLQRRDAATGRRSNYDGRAVELQAKLADLDSRNAPAYAALQNNSMGGLATMLQSGLRYGGKSGWFGPEYTKDQGRVNPTIMPAPANLSSMSTPYEMQNSLDATQGDPFSLNPMARRNRVVGGL